MTCGFPISLPFDLGGCSDGSAATPEPESAVGRVSPFGYGLLRPFVRDRKRDWAADGGARLVAACIGQILGTRCSSEFTQGELPWRDEFGSLLYLLRHRPNDETTRELARVYVAEAVARWEPRAKVTAVMVTTEDAGGGLGRVLTVIRVRFDLVSQSGPGNAVLLQGLEVDVALR